MAMIGNNQKEPFSLYIHIPFCTKKCPYCHFFVIKDKEEDKDLLLSSLIKEWQYYFEKIKDRMLVSVYFGGGTPSLFEPRRVKSLLDIILNSGIEVRKDIEITLEANPETLTFDLALAYRQAGINRMSIGVQSFDEKTLEVLGRTHDVEKAIHAIHDAYNAGIKNISIDLMYDIPYQKVERWKEELSVIKTLPISHLSLYNLTFEPNTVFFKKKESLLKHVPSDELSLSLLNEAVEKIEEAGLKRYEISAFAKEGKFSLHNVGYWTARPFIGLGPSAFSYFEGKRFRNVANLRKYVEALDNHQSPVDFEEKLEGRDKIAELLAVEIRLLSGVDISSFEQKNGAIPGSIWLAIEELIKKGWVERTHNTLLLTEAGRLQYDSVAVEII